ncbi:RNA binding motif protein 19 [Perkinsus olseni]|uniref:RNA binding motif protein 19 n=2 Tax=Perkinsus olseni TaxID=32597 RepID=A0A7J6NHV8_PEROL|nr:RNA binding motif protein 19 [Perkinsus olseni]
MSTEKEGQSSRIIVKNLPKHVDDARLKEFFSAHGEVTDARVMKTKEGRSRCFGFVGFRSPAEAKKALRAVDKTFMDTSRLQSELGDSFHYIVSRLLWHLQHTLRDCRELGVSTPRRIREHRSTRRLGSHHNAPAVKSREERQAEEEERRNAVMAGNAEVVTVPRVRISAAINHVSVSDAGNGREGIDRVESELSVDVCILQKVEHVGVRRGKAGVASVRTHVAFKDEDEDSSDDEGSTVEGEHFLRSKMVASEDKKDDESAEDGEEDNEEAEGESDAGGEDSDAVLMDTARLLLVNLPYIATEDDIKKAFSVVGGKFGSIEDVVVLRDEDSKKSRGMAYVTYLFPEHAVRAKAEMHGKLHISYGFLYRFSKAVFCVSRQLKLDQRSMVERDEKRLSRKQEQLRKRRENAEQHTWNLLFVSANSAVSAAANKLGLTKADIMDVEADDLAVRAAVGETEVVREVKQWLKEEGVRVDAFERKAWEREQGEKPKLARSKDTLILKHLPAESVTLAELRAVIGKYVSAAKDSEHSAMQKLLLAPTKTVAIAQFVDGKTAQHAFKKLSYRRFKNAPLYVEWAPENIFEPKGDQEEREEKVASDEHDGAAEESSVPMEGVEEKEAEPREEPSASTEEETAHEEEDVAGSVSVFVKGLNFDTTEEALRQHFMKQTGYIKCTISRKTMPDGRQLSMGFGFVEFKNSKAAKECIKRLQGSSLDGRTLELQMGRGGKTGGGHSASNVAQAGVTQADTKGATNRLCVRNVAFEASRRDIRKLFSTYGNVVAVRMPLKVDRSGHRGFAFVEFVSRSEALAAMEALQHTHLYGRRLVLEPAAHEDTSIETARLKQDMKEERKRHERMNESAKRRKINALEE